MLQFRMKKINIDELKKKLAKEYKSENSVTAIINGNRQPNSTIRYRYEKELKIPFDGWGDELRKYVDGLCPCCGTIMRKKKD